MNLENLYTARWYLSKGQSVPEGGPRETLLRLLSDRLGPGPDSDTGALPDPELPDLPGLHELPWLIPASERLPIVGRRFSPDEFREYLALLPDDQMDWEPSMVVIHHTASPSLKQRPHGFNEQHMRNLRAWYLKLGWSHGPHLFVDDNGIWIFSPLTRRGTHAVSFNRSGFGIEMLGNYDQEDPATGRGARVIGHAQHAAAALMDRFGLRELKFHRDDPRTRKSCPGTKIKYPAFARETLSLREKP